MPATKTSTEQITITLPHNLAQVVRAKVASGKYANESDFVSELILEDADSFREEGCGPSDDWIVKHALPVLEKLEADPSSGIPMEEVEGELQRRRDARRKQAA